MMMMLSSVTGKSIVDDEIDHYLKEPCKKSMLICFAFGKKTLKLIQEFQKLLKKFYPSLLPQQLLRLFSVAGKIYRPE